MACVIESDTGISHCYHVLLLHVLEPALIQASTRKLEFVIPMLHSWIMLRLVAHDCRPANQEENVHALLLSFVYFLCSQC